MRKHFVFFLALTLAATLLVPVTASAEPVDRAQQVETSNEEELIERSQNNTGELHEEHELLVDFSGEIPVVREPTEQDEDASTEINAEKVLVPEDVQYVPLNADPYAATQWHHQTIGTEQAWAIAGKGAGVTVAVLDTGLPVDHTEFAGRIREYKDFMSGVGGTYYHGSAVTGIIAAAHNNGVGAFGVAPEATILSARVCDPQSCSNKAIYEGMVWAVESGANIINLSLGSTSMDPAMVSLANWATSRGVTIVAAAGNSACQLYVYSNGGMTPNGNCNPQSNPINYPAAASSVIGVAAVEQNGQRASYSSYGNYVDISAPVNVVTSGPQASVTTSDFAGTSAASPVVAGVATLVLGANPALKPREVQAVLQSSATPHTSLFHSLWQSCTYNSTTRVWENCVGPVNNLIPTRALGGAGTVNAARATQLAKQWGQLHTAPQVESLIGSLAVTVPTLPNATQYQVEIDGITSAQTATPQRIVIPNLATATQYSVVVHGLNTSGARVASTRPLLAETASPNIPTPVVTQVKNLSTLSVVVVDPSANWDSSPLQIVITSPNSGDNPRKCLRSSQSSWEFFCNEEIPIPDGNYSAVFVTRDGTQGTPSTQFSIRRGLPAQPEIRVSEITANSFTTETPIGANISGYLAYDRIKCGWVEYRLSTQQIFGDYGRGAARTDCQIVCQLQQTPNGQLMRCTFTGLTEGQRVSALIAAKSGAFLSPAVSVPVTPQGPPPSPPANIRQVPAQWVVANSPAAVGIQWTAPQGVNNFNCFWETPLGNTPPAAGGCSFIVLEGVVPTGTTSKLRVQSIRYTDGGNWAVFGPLSEPVTVTVPAFDPPTLSCNRTTTGITCSGARSPQHMAGHTKYRAQILDANNNVVREIANLNEPAFSASSINGPAPWKAQIRVEFNWSSESYRASAWRTFTMPVVVTASASHMSATVNWETPQGVSTGTTYTATSTPAGKTCVTTGTSCQVTGLTNGTSYTFTVTAKPTTGATTTLGSSNAVTPQPTNNSQLRGNPFGAVDLIRQEGPRTLRISGWTLDPDTIDPIPVHVYVGATLVGGYTANTNRPDIGNIYRGYGNNHGYNLIANNIPAGTHNVCVFAINTGNGNTNPLLGCRSIRMLAGNPIGNFETTQRINTNQVRVIGWTLDPDTVDPIPVHVYTGNRFTGGATANTHRPDIGRAYPGYGNNHGYNIIVNARAGETVCVYAINRGAGTTNPLLSCRRV